MSLDLSTALSQAEFQRLVDLVAALPEWGEPHTRRLLVTTALAGSPNAGRMLGRLDLTGGPATAATETLQFLSTYGQVAYGVEALAVFLNYVLQLVGVDHAAFIEQLLARRTGAWRTGVAAELPIEEWLGDDEADLEDEVRIGESALRHVCVLELALAAARLVAQVAAPSPQGWIGDGTCFVCGPGLLMTNHHVIADADAARQAEVTFNYQLLPSGDTAPTIPAHVSPNGAFYTSADLDFTVFEFEPSAPLPVGHLRLRDQRLQRGEAAPMIGHPAGHLKKVALYNNRVLYADGRIIQYTTTTLKGSSGSPVFNENFEVVAIHKGGGRLRQPNSPIPRWRNQGISMIAILANLRQHQPDLFRRIHA